MIAIRYIGHYENPETGEIEQDKEGVSVVSKEAYEAYKAETEWKPCVCDVQGCLSCFLDEQDAWADGYFGAGFLWIDKAYHDRPRVYMGQARQHIEAGTPADPNNTKEECL